VTSTQQDLRGRIKKAIASQKPATITPLSSLLAVQDELGYIPDEAVDEVAQHTNTTINDVWGIASFYTNFRFKSPRDHAIEVCWGAPCHVLGAMEVIASVLEVAGLSGEGDTHDGKLSVTFNTCLGVCSNGPAISVDHEIIGRLSAEKATELMIALNDTGAQSETNA